MSARCSSLDFSRALIPSRWLEVPEPPARSGGAPSAIFAPGLLDGKVALITGGGTGLGRAAAGELVACGANVLISGRRPEVLRGAAAEIGERCSWVAGDI